MKIEYRIYDGTSLLIGSPEIFRQQFCKVRVPAAYVFLDVSTLKFTRLFRLHTAFSIYSTTYHANVVT